MTVNIRIGAWNPILEATRRYIAPSKAWPHYINTEKTPTLQRRFARRSSSCFHTELHLTGTFTVGNTRGAGSRGQGWTQSSQESAINRGKRDHRSLTRMGVTRHTSRACGRRGKWARGDCWLSGWRGGTGELSTECWRWLPLPVPSEGRRRCTPPAAPPHTATRAIIPIRHPTKLWARRQCHGDTFVTQLCK